MTPSTPDDLASEFSAHHHPRAFNPSQRHQEVNNNEVSEETLSRRERGGMCVAFRGPTLAEGAGYRGM